MAKRKNSKKAIRKTSKGSKTTKTAKAKTPKAPPPECYCGCGKTTGNAKRRFLQGHDARLHSHFLKVCKGEMAKSVIPDRPEVIEFIKGAKWATEDLLKQFRSAA